MNKKPMGIRVSDTMLKFVTTARNMPAKSAVGERLEHWDEIYARFDPAKAAEQSARCSQCGVPFCQVHCPLHNNIPDWLMLTAAGRLEEAYELTAATNTLPEICGRICPQDRLCEGNCVIETAGHETVTIGSVETYIVETAFENGWVKPVTPRRELDHSVAIIGAGPAGFAAAEALRRRGYQIHIYDRYDRAGGLLMYGIPSFKLEKDIVIRRTRLLEAGGVTFHMNFEVGRDASLADLRARHDAVLIATGVYKARDMAAPGSGLANIIPAMRYLTASNRKGLGDAVADFDDGTLNATGRDIVVIGGGDTAMDCVRTAVRQGAKSVKCLYRRDRKNMPGSMREVTNAEEEGVEFVWRSAPEAFHGEGTVSAVRAQRMRLGPPDASGRQSPEPMDDSHFNIATDLVIKALGFDPEDIPAMFDDAALKVSRWGTVQAELGTGRTNLEGVFAAGDIVRGASLVVWAIRDGRDCAEAIHRFISAKASAELREAS
ncbi:MAG: NAD(P)-dependent oxidoreductase [Alphaproteobacteria bacterium]